MSAFRKGDIASLEVTILDPDTGDGLALTQTPGGSHAWFKFDELALVRAAPFAFGDEVRVELGDRKGLVLAVTEDNFFAWVRFTRDDGTPDLRTVETRILKRWDGKDDAEGWASWEGAIEPPVDWRTEVEVRYRNGTERPPRPAHNYRWNHIPSEKQQGEDIVAYRVVKPEEGPTWIGWNGGPCPVDAETKVRAKTRNGGMTIAKAGLLRWSHGDGSHKSTDIIAYYVLTGGC